MVAPFSRSYGSDKVASGTAESCSGCSSGLKPVFRVLRPSASASFWASSRPSGVSAYLGGEGHMNFYLLYPWHTLLPSTHPP